MMGLIIGLRFTLLALIVPAYVIALKRRWWTTLPLWLVSTCVMLTQFAMSTQQSVMAGGWSHPSAFVYVGEMTKIMIIPIGVQIAVMLNGMGFGMGARAGGRQWLMKRFSVSER
jgi:hypothetical protein